MAALRKENMSELANVMVKNTQTIHNNVEEKKNTTTAFVKFTPESNTKHILIT